MESCFNCFQHCRFPHVGCSRLGSGSNRPNRPTCPYPPLCAIASACIHRAFSISSSSSLLLPFPFFHSSISQPPLLTLLLLLNDSPSYSNLKAPFGCWTTALLDFILLVLSYLGSSYKLTNPNTPLEYPLVHAENIPRPRILLPTYKYSIHLQVLLYISTYTFTPAVPRKLPITLHFCKIQIHRRRTGRTLPRDTRISSLPTKRWTR